MPAHRYDRGEVHNLSVGRGTLTEEERYKINEHIVQTIIMLEKLPFPRHLQERTGDRRAAITRRWTAAVIRAA